MEAGALIEKWLADDPKLRALVEEETANFKIAQLVYDARTQALLTQQQLADLIGTAQPAIARLEDADYRGHSLRMLRRVAGAVGQDLEVSFAPGAPAKKGRREDSAFIPVAAFGHPDLRVVVDDEDGNARVAQLLRGVRTRAKLTQRELAKLVGTTQPVIARLENGAYKGHSLGMLQRIAAALGCDLELRLARRRG